VHETRLAVCPCLVSCTALFSTFEYYVYMKVLTVAVTSSVTTVQVASSTITASSLGSTESMLDPWEGGR
jgi:hypothetical protein